LNGRRIACEWLKVQATITIVSVGEVPSNAREKNPWSTLSKKWIKLYNAIGNCSVKLEAVGLTRIRAHTRQSPGWAQFVPI
jgi:hypothetical protein